MIRVKLTAGLALMLAGCGSPVAPSPKEPAGRVDVVEPETQTPAPGAAAGSTGPDAGLSSQPAAPASGRGEARATVVAGLPAGSADGHGDAPDQAATQGDAAWFELGWPADLPLVYAANGRWYAMMTSAGVVLGDSSTFELLCAVDLNVDKAGAVLFRPQSDFLVASFDFSLRAWAIVEDAAGVTLKPMDPALPVVDGVGALAFNHNGRYLAGATSYDAVLYDFEKRRPLFRLDPGFSVEPDAIGFSGDRFFMIQTTSAPCKCDDFQGSDAAVAAYRIGERKMTAQRLQGDVSMVTSLRAGLLAAGSGLWNVRTGRRLMQQRLEESQSITGVYRMRASRLSVGLLYSQEANPKTQLVLLGDKEGLKKLGDVVEELFCGLSVRPQGDLAVYTTLDSKTDVIRVHAIPIEEGEPKVVTLPSKVCVRNTRVVPDQECKGTAVKVEQSEPAAAEPEWEGDLPVYRAPELPSAKHKRRLSEGNLFRKIE